MSPKICEPLLRFLGVHFSDLYYSDRFLIHKRKFIQLGVGVRSRARRRTILGLTSGLVAVSKDSV